MPQRERCPRCSSGVWYPTDLLGRVTAWCDTCRAEVVQPPIVKAGVTDKPKWTGGRRTPRPDEIAAIMGAVADGHATGPAISAVTGIPATVIRRWNRLGHISVLKNTKTERDATRARHQATLDAGAPWPSMAAAARGIGITVDRLRILLRTDALSLALAPRAKGTGRRSNTKGVIIASDDPRGPAKAVRWVRARSGSWWLLREIVDGIGYAGELAPIRAALVTAEADGVIVRNGNQFRAATAR